MAHREVQPALRLSAVRPEFRALNPHNFSFKQSLGWCRTCEGLGVQKGANASLLIRDPNLSCATAPSVPGRSEGEQDFPGVSRKRWPIMAASRSTRHSSS